MSMEVARFLTQSLTHRSGVGWSAPIRLNWAEPLKSLYGFASNQLDQLVVVTSSEDGKLVARTVVDSPPKEPVQVAPTDAEPTAPYKPKSGAMTGVLAPIDIGISEATVKWQQAHSHRGSSRPVAP
jgi:hypothetical protein